MLLSALFQERISYFTVHMLLLQNATVVYYESIKRKLKIKCIYECRCDERLQTATKEFTRLSYTGLVVELEHLKILSLGESSKQNRLFQPYRGLGHRCVN
jgi:hypothetical protein